MLDEIVKMTEFDLSTIDAIAVAGGPGSFTGLRIGSATAKGLGLALEKPIIPVETIDAMAYNLWGIEKLICPIMDARNKQVYTGLYTFENDNFVTHIPQCIVPITEMIENINQKQNMVGIDMILDLVFRLIMKMEIWKCIIFLQHVCW